MTLAAVAAVADGVTNIINIAVHSFLTALNLMAPHSLRLRFAQNQRMKESNRLAAMVTELSECFF